MPMYYDVSQRAITAGTSETVQINFLTGTSKPTCSITGVFANSVGSTAGGCVFTGSTFATAGTSSGTAVTPGKRNPNNAAAQVVANVAAITTTGSSTRTVRIVVGFAQTGGQGGWVAVTPDTALQLVAGGGTNGYAEFASLANAASQTYNYTIEFYEN